MEAIQFDLTTWDPNGKLLRGKPAVSCEIAPSARSRTTEEESKLTGRSRIMLPEGKGCHVGFIYANTGHQQE